MPIYVYYDLMTIARLCLAGESPSADPKSTANEGVLPMQSSHVASLQTKHEGLERRIREEMCRPSPDEAIIQTLKKQKLRIKEVIAEL